MKKSKNKSAGKSKNKSAAKSKDSSLKTPTTELGLLEVETQFSTNVAKPTKEKLVAIEKNGKLISLV